MVCPAPATHPSLPISRLTPGRPVFALARDLGSVNADPASVLFTIGHAQQDHIHFQGKEEKPRAVPSLWREWFDESALVDFFYNDFSYASTYATNLDRRIASDAEAAGGTDFVAIASLAVRQVFGALGYTGTEEQPLVFLKEISSNSDIQTVDVIYPAFPIMLYLNPDLIRWTLDPLLENGRHHYPNNWAQVACFVLDEECEGTGKRMADVVVAARPRHLPQRLGPPQGR